MKKSIPGALALTLGVTFGLSGIASASAATWAQNHPRRVEVNGRLASQNRRINVDYKSGKITAQQAAQLHREDRTVRADERFDASFDHSHLTKADQRSLNQDENGVSGQIHADAH